MSVKLIYQNFGKPARAVFALASLCLLVFITMQSLGASHASVQVNNADKYAHALAYCTLGLAVFPTFPRLRPIIVWGVLTLYGCAMEVAQGAMHMGRTADILDAVANSTGAFLAIVLWVLVSLWRVKIKK